MEFSAAAGSLIRKGGVGKCIVNVLGISNEKNKLKKRKWYDHECVCVCRQVDISLYMLKEVLS